MHEKNAAILDSWANCRHCLWALRLRTVLYECLRKPSVLAVSVVLCGAAPARTCDMVFLDNLSTRKEAMDRLAKKLHDLSVDCRDPESHLILLFLRKTTYRSGAHLSSSAP